MSKKIIVTGGCGYIGSHVARAFKLESPANHVFVVDRVLRHHTLKDLDGFYVGDFASDDGLATIVDMQPDVIVHCAGTSLVGPSIDNPAEYYDNNINKTIKMLNVLAGQDKKPLIMFSSSASVYGNPKRIPINELDPKAPISPYGNTKYITEIILRDYCRAYRLNSVVFRYFNAAGAEPRNFDLGQEPGATHIVARALEASLANRAFTINGNDYNTLDGTCVRDYVHVWDIATAHIKGVEFMDKFTEDDINIGSMMFNLGTNKGISNKEIVDYVVEHYGLPFVNYGPRRAGDPDQLIADAHTARDLLGWTPQFSDIGTIIDSAYKWYVSR